MSEYLVMKKAEERARIMGVQPMYMFIGAILLMLSIVALFAGGPSFKKFICIILVDFIAVLVMLVLSFDKNVKKKYRSMIHPVEVTIKSK